MGEGGNMVLLKIREFSDFLVDMSARSKTVYFDYKRFFSMSCSFGMLSSFM